MSAEPLCLGPPSCKSMETNINAGNIPIYQLKNQWTQVFDHSTGPNFQISLSLGIRNIIIFLNILRDL